MINPDRSLPVVIPRKVSLFSPYGTPEHMLAIRQQMQMLIIAKCIADPIFFFNYVAAWNRNKQ